MKNLRSRNFESEFKFRTSRSSGAGGQHVNTTETKVELIFDVQASVLLNDGEKEKILKRLKTYLNDKGELRISSSESRSQSANKESAINKFYLLLTKAFTVQKKRIPTAMPQEIKEDIKRNKKVKSQKKRDRGLKTRDFL